MDYEALNAEVLAVSDRLRNADEATVAAEVERLTALAAEIPDDFSRMRAMARVAKLPELISGPALGQSEQYEKATHLVGTAMSADGTTEERIAVAERIASEIAELAASAPPRESGTILRMNSSVARLIQELREQSQED
ncbi:hypothetical protein ACIA49_19645 [Kribbella sp. NPDC051587]|uniref:hypothetical protein n=1 Tax=Kribbella sp. NPDC051587 TaxID=3364119 RepID=UPI0037B148E5